MLLIKDNNISLTRGDTAYLTISIPNYIFQPNDIVKMGVKRKISDSDYLFLKVIEIEEETEVAVIKILPEDTKNGYFEKYFYDVEFTQNATKDVNTIIPVSEFIILKEVS